MRFLSNPSVSDSRRLALIAICLTGVFSIGSQAQTVAPIKKKLIPAAAKPVQIPDIHIQGQVFVVTKGGINIKLALVNVSAYREKDLLEQLDNNWEKEKDERAEAKARVVEAIKAGERIQGQTAIARGHAEGAESYARIHGRDSTAVNALKETRAEFNRLLKAESAADDEVFSEMAKQAALLKPRHMIARLNTPLSLSKSDADGNFDIALPAGSYVLVAIGSRSIGDSTELYEWAVRVFAEKSVKVLLSNDNMVDTKCSDCVQFPVRSEPKT